MTHAKYGFMNSCAALQISRPVRLRVRSAQSLRGALTQKDALDVRIQHNAVREAGKGEGNIEAGATGDIPKWHVVRTGSRSAGAASPSLLSSRSFLADNYCEGVLA